MSSSVLPLAIFGLGMPEMLVIFAIVVLMFGAKKLPELAKGFGKSIREFKKASAEDETEEASRAPAPAPTEKRADPARTHGTN